MSNLENARLQPTKKAFFMKREIISLFCCESFGRVLNKKTIFSILLTKGWDFSETQLTRALRNLLEKRAIHRCGHGVYELHPDLREICYYFYWDVYNLDLWVKGIAEIISTLVNNFNRLINGLNENNQLEMKMEELQQMVDHLKTGVGKNQGDKSWKFPEDDNKGYY